MVLAVDGGRFRVVVKRLNQSTFAHSLANLYLFLVVSSIQTNVRDVKNIEYWIGYIPFF